MLDTLAKLVSMGAGLVTILGALAVLRRFRAQLRPEVSGRVFWSGGASYLIANVRLHNIGLAALEVEQEGSALVIYTIKDTTSRADYRSLEIREDLTAFPVFEDIPWIAAGETIEGQRLIGLPDNEAIGWRLRLRIVSKGREWWPLPLQIVSKGREWNASTIVSVEEE